MKITTPEQALQVTDLWDIKSALKMAYVLEHYGHHPATWDAGRLHYHSPFRDGDDRPSLDVFMHQIKGREAEEERFDDWADPNLNQGDVIDLIGLFEPRLQRVESISLAQDLLAEQIRSGWEGPSITSVKKKPFDASEVEKLLERGRPLDGDSWWNTVAGRPALQIQDLPKDRVFRHPTEDRILFVNRDENGDIKACRVRDVRGRKSHIPGGHNILMRMEAPSQKPVILTEGETDTWAAWIVFQETHEVLGVPGAALTPQLVAGHLLDGRDVTIAFDPDDAGQTGARNWAAYLSERGCQVRIAVLPEGRDLSSLQIEDIQRLPERARVALSNPTKIVRQADNFVWLQGGKNEGVVAVSNWSFEPRSVLVGEDGERSYEGILLPLNKSVVLPAYALSSLSKLRAWGVQHQARWLGSDAQVQHLAAYIDHEAAFLPEGRVTSQVGLHEGAFVWHGGSLGAGNVFFDPGPTARKMADNIFVEEVPCDQTKVFWAMYGLQNPSVTGPILSWLAIAPLRSRFKQFPILSVSGVSGSGKTALVEAMLTAFSSSNIASNLTSSTAHGVFGTISSSNGFPVWFDEYRPGARDVAKQALDQIIRDAYTGQKSVKGGQNQSNLNETAEISTDAPIIVSGEDDFTETSHVERMVLVRLRRQDQGPMRDLLDLDTRGFGAGYLKSLLSQETFVEDPPVYTRYSPAPIEGLSPRLGYNLAALEIGWRLLESYLQQQDPMFRIPALDLSAVIPAGVEAGRSDPTMEAVQHCWENPDTFNESAVWDDGHFLYVHPQTLLNVAAKLPGVQLPGSSSRALRGVLSDKYNGVSARKRRHAYSNPVHVVQIPLSEVDWWEPEEQEPHENHFPQRMASQTP